MFTKIPCYHCFQGLFRSLLPSRPAFFRTLMMVHRFDPACRILGFYSLTSERFLRFSTSFIVRCVDVCVVHALLFQRGPDPSSQVSCAFNAIAVRTVIQLQSSYHTDRQSLDFALQKIATLFSFGQDVSSRNCCICNVVPASFLNCFCSLAGLLSSTCEFPRMFMSYSRKSQTIVRLLPPIIARTATSRDRQ